MYCYLTAPTTLTRTSTPDTKTSSERPLTPLSDRTALSDSLSILNVLAGTGVLLWSKSSSHLETGLPESPCRYVRLVRCGTKPGAELSGLTTRKRAGNTYLEDFQLFRLPNVCFGGVTSFAGDPANGVFDEPPSYRCANTTYFYKQTLLYYKDKLYLGHI
jgi:hypothetical protein